MTHCPQFMHWLMPWVRAPMLPSKFCPQPLPKSTTNSVRFSPATHASTSVLQTLRAEVAHADVAAIASYQLFSSFRCNSAVYWNFTITWDWYKYSQMYLNTKYKGNWIANAKWKSIEILNNYSRKCKYISDTF